MPPLYGHETRAFPALPLMDAGDTINPPAALCAGRPRYKSANRMTPVARGRASRRNAAAIQAASGHHPPVANVARRANRHITATRAIQAAGRQRHDTTPAAIYSGRARRPAPPPRHALPIGEKSQRRPKGGQRPRRQAPRRKERESIMQEMNDAEFLRMVGQLYEYALRKEDDNDYMLNTPQYLKLVEAQGSLYTIGGKERRHCGDGAPLAAGAVRWAGSASPRARP